MTQSAEKDQYMQWIVDDYLFGREESLANNLGQVFGWEQVPQVVSKIEALAAINKRRYRAIREAGEDGKTDSFFSEYAFFLAQVFRLSQGITESRQQNPDGSVVINLH